MHRVSVIIPAWNAEQYLAQALESVLAQERLPFEILVVDDGSTDGTAAVAASYAHKGVKLYSRDNGGTAAALNTGINAAAGELLAFLDADDLWTADKLKLQLQAFQEHEGLEAVFGYLAAFLSPELSEKEKLRLHVPAGAIEGYHKGAMLIRRQALLRVGLFNEQVRTGDFIEWFLRARENQLKTTVLPQVVYRRRYHARNHGLMVPQGKMEYVRWLKESLDRRRAAQE